MTMRQIMLKTTALSVCFTALAGCTQKLGPEADTIELRGDISRDRLAQTAVAANVVTINGSALEQGKKYRLSRGVLIIHGDIPARARVEVEAGRMIVHGNVGPKAGLHAYMPENSRVDIYSCGGRYKTTCRRKIMTGLAFPSDKTPGIQVNGTAAPGVTAYSNAGVWLRCAAKYEDVDMGQSAWGRPSTLKQIGACNAIRP